MQLCCDRAGFPLLTWPEGRLQVSLLPVLKVQFERFLCEPGTFGDARYEEALATNPRASWRRPGGHPRERLFLTGVLPGEALEFLHWLGPGFDLPEVGEWRGIERWLQAQPFAPGPLAECPMSEPARAIVVHLIRELYPVSWSQLALFRGGVLEWVRSRDGFAGLGAPSPRLLANTFDPQAEAPVQPGDDGRYGFFGLRPVRRLRG